MHLPINVKSPNNISKWQMGFNSAFKGLSSPKINIANCSPVDQAIALQKTLTFFVRASNLDSEMVTQKECVRIYVEKIV
jgi:hypothetical protein